MCNKKCPICGGNVDEVFDLGLIPTMNNVLSNTYDEALKAQKGKQTLGICKNCGFVTNICFDDKLVKYQDGYHCERTSSSIYNKYIYDIIKEINDYKKIDNANILEIGCGTGEFLKEVAKYNQFGKPKAYIGIDPSAIAIKKDNFEIISKEFDYTYVENNENKVDILINRHMIEHISNPSEILKMFSKVLSNDGVLYLETPSLDWILENKVFFDFPYEHCSYFTNEFICRLFEYTGFEIINISSKYDGQYLSIYAKKKQFRNNIHSISIDEINRVKKSFYQMNIIYNECKNKIMPSNNICIWGSAAKGCMWVNLFDRNGKYTMVDINSNKQNKYVLVTGNKILSPELLIVSPPDEIIIMNSIYEMEIKQFMNKLLLFNNIKYTLAESIIKVNEAYI